MNDNDVFKKACFSGFSSLEGFSDQQVKSWREKWVPGTTCRGCKKEVRLDNFAVWVSYWMGLWFPSHTDCVKVGKKEEAFLCQQIDSDCNDCKHFIRGEKVNSLGDRYGQFKGTCSKFSKPVIASVNFCSGLPCFEHRLNS